MRIYFLFRNPVNMNDRSEEPLVKTDKYDRTRKYRVEFTVKGSLRKRHMDEEVNINFLKNLLTLL